MSSVTDTNPSRLLTHGIHFTFTADAGQRSAAQRPKVILLRKNKTTPTETKQGELLICFRLSKKCKYTSHKTPKQTGKLQKASPYKQKPDINK